MKTLRELALQYVNQEQLEYEEAAGAYEGFLAGYKAAQPKWISVKERRPELGLHVLTYGIYTKDLIVAWLDDCDEFLGMYDWVNEHQSLDQVTHWMPLPEPLKEEK